MNPDDASGSGMVKSPPLVMVALALAVLLAAHLVVKLVHVEQGLAAALALGAAEGGGGAMAAIGPDPLPVDAIPWNVISAPAAAADVRGPLANRFSLIGMYLAFGGNDREERCAVLADAQTSTERIVRIHDKIDQISIVDIQADHVVLRDPLGEETLWLRFTGRPVTGEESAATPESDRAGHFGGRRLGPRRWEFERPSLLGYYRDLMNHPERLVRLFDSMKPVYEEDGKISGYRLGVEGESEFFDAVGLKEGDVVRKVNELGMSNRSRAEFFIRQFVLNNLSAFVLDVERGGESIRMLYQVRE